MCGEIFRYWWVWVGRMVCEVVCYGVVFILCWFCGMMLCIVDVCKDGIVCVVGVEWIDGGVWL